MAYRFELRGGTAANWAATNPMLALHEPGVESDTGKLKVGDGVTLWNDLPYVGEIDLTAAGTSFDPDGMAYVTGSNVQTAIGELDAAIAAATRVTFSDEAGTAYTLVLADAGKVVRCTAAGAVTLTVPDHASVAFPVGTVIEVYAAGAGGVTVEGDVGVTVRNAGTLAQHGSAVLTKHDTDEWVLTGAQAVA